METTFYESKEAMKLNKTDKTHFKQSETLKSSTNISPQLNGHTAYPVVYLSLKHRIINHTLKNLITKKSIQKLNSL